MSLLAESLATGDVLTSSVLAISLGNPLSFLGGINFVLIGQLTMLALVVISGPAVVFLLALRGGDL